MSWMRQKSEGERTDSTPTAPVTSTPSTQAPRRETSTMEKLVNIGQSVQIKGELTGNEDLTIDGMVDGKILVRDFSLTVGTNGKINAEVHAKTVIVVGQVTGNITADDKVEIAPSGSVEGDIRAPRVAIADGAQFKGSIDMDRGKTASMPVKPQGTGATVQKQMPMTAGAVKG